MTTNLDSSEPDLNRHFADRKIDRITREIEFSGDQVGAWSRWLTASLLAINGAGALAALNLAKDHQISWSGGISFASGIILALLSGTLLQELYNRRIGPILKCDEYWGEVRFTGVRKPEKERELGDEVDKASRFAWIAPSLGWMSGILFLVGAYFLAANFS